MLDLNLHLTDDVCTFDHYGLPIAINSFLLWTIGFSRIRPLAHLFWCSQYLIILSGRMQLNPVLKKLFSIDIELHIVMSRDSSENIFRKFIWRKGRKKIMVNGNVGENCFCWP